MLLVRIEPYLLAIILDVNAARNFRRTQIPAAIIRRQHDQR